MSSLRLEAPAARRGARERPAEQPVPQPLPHRGLYGCGQGGTWFTPEGPRRLGGSQGASEPQKFMQPPWKVPCELSFIVAPIFPMGKRCVCHSFSTRVPLPPL